MDWGREESDAVRFHEGTEIDLDFEFDAPMFYDFTIEETESDIHVAELWFSATGGYPSSPVCASCSWQRKNPNYFLSETSSDTHERIEVMDSPRTFRRTMQGTRSSDLEPYLPAKRSQRKISNFMVPTASHLAKQHNAPEIRCERLLRRFQSLSFKGEQKSSWSPRAVPRAAKRQKLEDGDLFKVELPEKLQSRRCELATQSGNARVSLHCGNAWRC